MAAPIEIVSERELDHGWAFAAQVLSADGGLLRCELRLSYADYNLWSPDGAIPPSRVAEAVLTFVHEQLNGSDLPRRFDAAQARRMFHNADQGIRQML